MGFNEPIKVRGLQAASRKGAIEVVPPGRTIFKIQIQNSKSLEYLAFYCAALSALSAEALAQASSVSLSL